MRDKVVEIMHLIHASQVHHLALGTVDCGLILEVSTADTSTKGLEVLASPQTVRQIFSN